MRRRPRLLPFAALFLCVTAGCATAGGGSTNGNANVITTEELRTIPGSTAFQAVQRLRPAWLRGRRAAAPPVVFLDGVRMGGIDVLRDFRADQLGSILHRSGSDATTLYGTGVGGGTIELRTRR